jgi:outer membrane receptor protein involved in Fe transport
VTNRRLLAATALQTGALALFATATPSLAQPTTQAVPPTTVVNPPADQTTNSKLPETTIPVTEANNATSSPSDRNIVVTGSRIRRPNLESVIPVTSIQGEQFFQRGNTSVGDQLNDLPQLRSTFAQQNPGLGVGIAGLNLLDLRGLGPKRTLVLVNGRRHVAADILSSASVPDVNTISNDLISRVDIVTGGNSAVYGSDAIAGVVNFILKRDFNGLQVRAQGAEAAAGFGLNYIGSVMWGKNFDGGKGNVTLQGEYSKQDRFFASDVPWYRRADAFVVADVDAGLPTSAHNSDGFPDRVLVQDVRSSTIHRFGLVPITQQTAAFGVAQNAACGTGLGGTNGGPSTIGAAASSNGIAFNCTYIFNPDGTLVQQTGSRAGVGPNPSFIGGNGQNSREEQQVSVYPTTKRINLNLLAHYTVSDAFEPFVEAKWVRIDSTGNNAGPSFIQGTGTFDYRERPRLDNPFLNPAARATIASALLASGCNPSLSATCATAVDTSTDLSNGGTGQGTGGRLSANDIALINSGAYRFIDARNLTDLGIRDQAFRRDTWRVVGGARGTFNSDWNYEISANYGQFNQSEHDTGYLDKQRFMLSMDAGRNPVTGQIQCRSQFDPAAAKRYSRAIGIPALEIPERALEAARLAADIAACVPYNPFGGGDNSAAINYFTFDQTKTAKMTQFDVLGFVNGDSSQVFELPGGPVSFVLGGEYRAETARYLEDPFVLTGQSNSVNVGNFEPPKFHVAEAFGEINIPILKDRPFFHDLTINGAGRYSHYQAPVNGVWTWNYGGEWSPIQDIRFRGNYGKSVRAPNVAETGFPPVPNFAPTYQDPCSTNAITQGSGTRQAACLADVGALQTTIRNGQYSLGVFSGSNPNLVPEVSHSLTLGGVLQPRFIPGFSLSVDYYNIKVSKVIVAVGARQIVENCYDLPAGNAFCGLFTRWRGPGTGPAGENPGEVLFNSITQAGLNFAKRVRRGIDFNANYRAHLGSNVTLDSSLIWVHGLTTSNFENPATPGFENQILGELGDPKDEGRLDADLKVGHVTFGYNVHYISPMYINLAEDQISLPSACTTPGDPTSCPPNNADFATPGKFPAITYHGIRVQWDTGPFMRAKNIQFYAGVDNVFDRHPPLGLTATGAGPGGFGSAAIYDVFGRKYYGGIKANF